MMASTCDSATDSHDKKKLIYSLVFVVIVYYLKVPKFPHRSEKRVHMCTDASSPTGSYHLYELLYSCTDHVNIHCLRRLAL